MNMAIEGTDQTRPLRAGDHIRERQANSQDRVVQAIQEGYVVCNGVASGRVSRIGTPNLKRYVIVDRAA
jgi:hypothetical protein